MVKVQITNLLMIDVKVNDLYKKMVDDFQEDTEEPFMSMIVTRFKGWKKEQEKIQKQRQKEQEKYTTHPH